MCAMKTPRTIVEECLNSSRTHSSDIMLNRQRGRLVRTPDRQTRSTERKLKHDRVSSLRSKRSLSSTEEELTPRQLIEGFFEGNDSTVPLLRNRRRTSQSGVSASQPALPVTGRWSSPIATGNLTMDMMDKDTPRTLLQRVLHNATDIIETPQVIKGLPSPQVQTPVIPVVEHTYHTPSPFKAVSVDTGSTGSSSIRRFRTPRSTTGKFNISAPDNRDNISSSSESAFLSPANYEEPSIFQDTSESDIFESQSVKNDSNQTTRNRGGFNITVPSHLVDELSRYQQSVQNDDEDGGDDDGVAGRHNTEEPMVIQETYREYELPLKSDNSDRFNGDSDQGSLGDADGQFRDESASRSILRGGDDSVQKSLRSELRRRSETQSEYTASRRSVSGKGEQSVKNSYNSVDDLENEVVMETSIQSPGEAEEVYETEDGDYVDSNGRHVDINREGRYSVGHTSRFESPINDRRSRMSEGHKRSNQGHIDNYFLPTQEHQQSLYKETEKSHSNENLTYPESSQKNLNTTNRNRTERLSEGQDNEQMSRRHHSIHSSGVLETKNETYYQEKLAGSRTDHIHTLPNTSSSFSPTISSTQKLVTVNGDVIEDSPLQTVTPSPVVSPNMRSRMSGSVSRQNTSSDGSWNMHTPQSNSSNRSNRKRSIEVASTPQSTSLNRSTPISGRKTALLSPQNSTNVTIRRMSSQGSHTPRSEVMSSPQNLDTRRTSPRRARTPQSRSKSNRTSGRSPTSPVVAGRINNQQGLVQGLPNNTAFFSPQVASTQNVATISRLSASRTTTGAREDNNEVDDDDAGQWEDDMEIEEVQSSRSTPVQTETVAAKEKKAPRKPRQKSNYSIPVTIVKKHFTHFAGMRVSKEAIEEVMKASEKYWDNLAADLDAYAKHAGRKTIQMADFVLLFKRQGLVTEKQSLNSLIEKYLPMEEREKLIHVARAGNRIEPKL